MMLRGLLVLAALIAAAAASITKFHISGVFTCPLPNFRYHLVVVEDDIFYNDYISHQQVQGGQYNTPYSIDASDDDDGWFNWEFELWMKVYHTCNPYGARKWFWVDLGSWPIVSKTFEITYSTSLYNVGENTMDFKRRFFPTSSVLQGANHTNRTD